MGFSPGFATNIRDIDRNNVIYVESINAFPAPVNGVITLPDRKVFTLTKPLNTGNVQFTTVPGGVVIFNSVNERGNPWSFGLSNLDPLFFGDFARIQFDDVDLIDTTGETLVFNQNSQTTPRGVLAITRSTLTNAGKIADITSTTISLTLNTYSGCKGGFTLREPGALIGSGADCARVAMVGQQGDHFEVIGNADYLSFDAIFALPATGDRVYNFDQTINNVSRLPENGGLINPIFGGTSGLERTVTNRLPNF